MNTQSLDLEFKINKYATGYILTKCNSTKSIINIPSQYNGKPVVSIYKGAFKGCSLLRNIFIPNSIAYIGDSAFYGCGSLMCVTIPNSVIYIEKYAFWGCKSLRQLTIGNSVKSIGKLAFYGCSLLTNVRVPNSVKSIGKGVFRECNSLTSITVPLAYVEADCIDYFGYIDYLFSEEGKRLFPLIENYFVPPSLKKVIITEGADIRVIHLNKNSDPLEYVTNHLFD